MLLSKKLKIFLNYFLGPVIFLWLSVSIYNQVQKQTDVHGSWEFIKAAFVGPESWKILLAFLLMPLHWAIESCKWQRLIGHIQKVSFLRSFRAILFGQAIAFSTPNRVGESVGRVVFLDEGKRLKGIALTIVGIISQLLVTFLMGLVSIIYLHDELITATGQAEAVSAFWYKAYVIIAFTGACILLLLYYRLAWIIKRLEKIPVIHKYRFMIESLEDFRGRELTGILLLSASRFVIYLVQYVLLLHVFKVDVPVLEAMGMVSVLLLSMAVIPSITLADLGFRGKIGLVLFSLYSSNAVGIIAVTAGIWIINLFIPAIAGTVVLLGVRLFRNKRSQ